MKTIKNCGIVFTALTIILSVLLVTNCLNPLAEIRHGEEIYAGEEENYSGEEENHPVFTPGKGAIQLKFGGDFRSTVMPGESLADLKYFIEIAHTDGLVIDTLPGISLSKAESPITLYVGEYYIYVFGCDRIDRTKNEAALVGEQKVEVAEGGITPAFIEMKGNMKSTVKGTFTYNLSSPIVPAHSTIFINPYFDGEGSTPSPIVLTDTSFTANGEYSSYIDLLPGYYNVVIQLGKTNYETGNERYMLHIYPTLTTHLNCSLSPLVKTGDLKVTFDSNQDGASWITREKPANIGETIAPLSAGELPTHATKELTGDWRTERTGGIIWDFAVNPVFVDLVLYAQWKNKWVVTFNADGGTPAPGQQHIADGGKVTQPSTMNKSGYTFGGWYRESGFATAWNFDTDTVTSDITLYAKWIKRHIVTYYGNPPATADEAVQRVPASITVDDGAQLTRPTPSPTLAGHTLYQQDTNDQWYTSPTVFNDDTRWSFNTGRVDRDMDLYARWTINTYTVTYHANHSGSTWTSTPITVPYNTILNEPTIPPGEMRTGYKLIGWRDGGIADLWVFEDDKVKKNLSFYAQWEKEEDNEITGDIEVDADDDFTVILGKEAWSHGFRINISNSLNGGSPFVWTVEAAGGYKYTWDEDNNQLLLPGVGNYDSTLIDPNSIRIDSQPVWWNTSVSGPWNGPRFYKEPNMVWLYEKGHNPIIITVEYRDQVTNVRKTLTFEITFKPE
jgi:uncharacterized repeat protein (TIGR02543 family)